MARDISGPDTFFLKNETSIHKNFYFSCIVYFQMANTRFIVWVLKLGEPRGFKTFFKIHMNWLSLEIFSKIYETCNKMQVRVQSP